MRGEFGCVELLALVGSVNCLSLGVGFNKGSMKFSSCFFIGTFFDFFAISLLVKAPVRRG